MKPTIGISIGDVNGIGPEIILKALNEIDLSESTPLIISPKKVLDFYTRKLKLAIQINKCNFLDEIDSNYINLLDVPANDLEIVPGIQSKVSGLVAMQSIELGIELASIGVTQAIVTAPISKEAVNFAGYRIPGHTEFLAEKTNTEEVLMMLVNEELRVALVTAHIPISEVSDMLSEELILSKLELLNESIKKDFGIDSPKIALFGLNPHAGDGGVIGDEELKIIIPTIKKAIELGLNVQGPFPADGFFGQRLDKEFDAILAMYHDQGLVPFKLLSFGMGVNFTAGLPIIRTSPDHGTAFNIAGKGVANPSSFIQAYKLAVHLSKKRDAD
ncbi:MAG: 4-hydroxythreonine-4-phosphate dehydrogenase PdxA [Balneolaceae bacterium]